VLGDKADVAVDAVKIDGKRVPPPVPQRYVLLNKPPGYVSTVSDPEGRPTVLDLVPPGLRKALVPVGRLDFQSEGLLLLTTDGEWAQRIAHPRYGCAKTYEVKVKGMPEERDVERLRRGMWIEGQRTLPAEVRLLRTTGRGRETGNSWWEVVLRQGRSRQIREMFFRIGNGVLKLHRVAIGPLRDPDLPAGAYRELTEGEVELLRKAGRTSAKMQGKKVAESEEEGREHQSREPQGREPRGRVPRRPPPAGGRPPRHPAAGRRRPSTKRRERR
ncbi:MAG TPA: pseudouridine synthase, partial [Thermoanaerobaculia bacterium]|nr:pseudouridine synthase [Thermoanaerobaculia bacterium]